MKNNILHQPFSRRHFLGSALAGAALASAPLARSATGDPLATLPQGRIRGITQDGVHIFKGIPYGGDTRHFRFKPAPAVANWRGIRDASDYGASAPQLHTQEPISEDCLFLNVWTPGLRDKAKRPVIVYIHGGGYTDSSGSNPVTEGSHLALRGDVVVISVNHRLNLFGYLFLAKTGGDTYRYSGNIGQLDLILALQWVRQNVAEFGGDANNVTLIGESGGGAKISTLMAMPAAAGLFHKAVTLSGQQVTAAGPRAATQRAEWFLSGLNLKPADTDKLLELPVEALLDASRIRDLSRIEDRPLEFLPVFDNVSLLQHPFYPEAPAQSANIPMIISNTRWETRSFSRRDSGDFDLQWQQLPGRLLTSQYVDIDPEVVVAEYRRLYPDFSPSEVFFAATTAGRSWRGAIIQAEARARQKSSAYVYQFDWLSPDDGKKFGGGHGTDLPLIFDNATKSRLSVGALPEAQKVADQLSGCLLAMAKTGKPNHSGIPDWKPYTLENRETLVVNNTSRIVNDPRGAERRFYAQAPFVQRGTF